MFTLIVAGVITLVTAIACTREAGDDEDYADGPVETEAAVTDAGSDAAAPRDVAEDPEVTPQPDTIEVDRYDHGEITVTPGAAEDQFLLKGAILVTFDKNNELSVIPNSELLFQGDEIVCVSDVANPCGATGEETVIDLPSTYKIYAGLIDTHDHPHYNAFPLFLHPGSDYGSSGDWRDSSEYDDWKAQWFDINKEQGKICQMYQYGIVRALAGGATTIQGVSVSNKCLRSSKNEPWILRQIDAYNGISPKDMVKTNSMGVDSLADDEVAKICTDQQSGKWNRFIIHLSEGKQGDPNALKEFKSLQTLGGGCLFNPKSVFIHCNAFTQDEFDTFALSGAQIVWSPSSNTDLYGFTAEASLDVPAALIAGISVALGPDWFPSHGIGMITEMQSARRYSNEFFGGAITPEQIYFMSTVAGAKIAGLEEDIGRLAPGMKADITIAAGTTDDPFEPAFLGDVAGVFVGGKIYYGDQAIMDAQNVPGATCEDLDGICGAAKTICLPPSYDAPDKAISYSSLQNSFVSSDGPFSAVPFDDLSVPEACSEYNPL